MRSSEIQQLTEHGLKVYWKEISPIEATRLLNGSSKNFRKMKGYRVEQYARSLTDDDWTPASGGTILLDKHGRLIDGQHRLSAVVSSDCSMTTLVIEGVAERDVMNADRGLSRNVSDYLSAKGYSNARLLASVIRKIWLVESGRECWDPDGRISLSVVNALDTLQRHPSVEEHIVLSNRCRSIVHQSLMAFVTYWGSHLVEDYGLAAANDFVDGIAHRTDGDNALPADDPRIRLSDRLLQDATAKTRLPVKYKLALLIMSWNAFLLERPLKVLRWTEIGRGKSEFPSFITASDLIR